MNGEKRLLVSVFAAIICILLVVLVISAPDLGITILSPSNLSYTYTNHTVNATTNPAASSCRYILDAATQGGKWSAITTSASWAPRQRHAMAVAPNGTIWLVGGYDGYSTYYNDIWYSTDGNTWAQANASAAFEGRYGHALVIRSDGSLWIMGGIDSAGNKTNDVWNSTDGAAWTLVNSSVAWENRTGLQALVTSDDVMWVIGGVNASSPVAAKKGDVWNSSNGADWKLVNGSAFPVRSDHAAVVGTNKRLWVSGGGGELIPYLNDVWYSDNGIAWQQANASSAIPWGRRYGHAMAFTPSDARIWVIGGYNSETSAYRNDVWYSQDGANWTQAVSSAEWTQRQYPGAAIMRNGTMIVAGGGYGAASFNDVWKSAAPVSMDGDVAGTAWGKEFNASEGSTFISVECNDTANVWNATNVSFYADTVLPALTIAPPYNMTYNASAAPISINVTVSETASSCVHSLNGAPNATMDGSGTAWGKEFTFAEGNNRIVVSCNDSANNRNSSSVSFFVDSIKPVLNITLPLNTTYSTTALTVNVTTNETASLCSYAHNTSGIEQNWALLNSSAFIARQGHTIVKSANGTLWLIGGAFICSGSCAEPNIYYNDTWYSTDGIIWIRANASTAFAGRAFHSSVATSDGKIWVIGGYDGTNYYNDSWYSSDGTNWVRANNSIFPERYAHASTVDSSGRMWVFGGTIPAAGGSGGGGFGVMGGGGTAALNDTWYSTDGAGWTQANASTGITSRYYATMAATSDGKIWIFGGKNSADAPLNDVWYSSGGVNWVQAASSAEWTARYGHISFSTPDDRLWVIGGLGAVTTNNEVWYSGNGTSWQMVNSTSNSSYWTLRVYSAGTVKESNIYMAGGLDTLGTHLNDSWATPIPPWYRDMDGSGTVWGKNFTASSGSNDIKVKCYDTAGNFNTSSAWFSVSLGFGMNLTQPFNTSYSTSSFTVNATTDSSVSQCSYSLNHAANVSMDGSTTAWGKAFTASNGASIITVSCNDSSNNWNISSVSFYTSFAVCGNNVCESGETASSCAADCPAAAAASTPGGGYTQAEKEIQGIINLPANMPIEKNYAISDLAINKIILTSANTVYNVKLNVQNYDTLPAGKKEPEGKLYRALEINFSKEINLTEAKICFNVKKQWLNDNNYAQEDIRLEHYKPHVAYSLQPIRKIDGTMEFEFAAKEEEWEKLPTEIAAEQPEEQKIEYCANTNSFSMFAIVASKPIELKGLVETAKPIAEQAAKPKKVIAAQTITLRDICAYLLLAADLILISFAIFLIITGNKKVNAYMEHVKSDCAKAIKTKEHFDRLIAFSKENLQKGYDEDEIVLLLANHKIPTHCGRFIIYKAKQQLKEERF